MNNETKYNDMYPKGCRTTALAAGTAAPDFSLRSTPDQYVSLNEFRGRPVILAFYPADWSPVCGDQMALYNEMLGEFQEFGAELLGISVDGAWCHAAFSKAIHNGVVWKGGIVFLPRKTLFLCGCNDISIHH